MATSMRSRSTIASSCSTAPSRSGSNNAAPAAKRDVRAGNHRYGEAQTTSMPLLPRLRTIATAWRR